MCDNKTVTRDEIQSIIWLHEKMRNSFFWNPPGSASGRRNYEQQNSFAVEGLFMRCPVSLKCKTDCSCKHIYYHGYFEIGNKKVTIAQVKKLIN